MANRACFIILISLCTISIFFSIKKLDRINYLSDDSKAPLYLPNGKYVEFISMGFDGMISDLILANVSVYCGKRIRKNKFDYVGLYKSLDLATTLDPYNRDAYLFGSRLLQDKNESNRLLSKAMKVFPDDWKLPEMIGFNYFYHLKEIDQAAKYYEIASKQPDHPPYVPSLAAKFYTELERYDSAIRVLKNFYDNTEDGPLKDSFGEDIKELVKRING